MTFRTMSGSSGEGPERQEAWRLRQRPDNEVPGSVGQEVLLVRTDEVAVFVSSMRAYRNGVDFTLEVRARHGVVDGSHDVGDGLHGTIDDQVLFGVEFSDGRSCTLHAGRAGARSVTSDDPVLRCGGGGAGTRTADMDLFLSPLPPPGDLRFVCAWPVRGIPESTVVVPAEQILRAAGRAQELWPWEPEPEPFYRSVRPPVPEGGWFATHMPADRDQDEGPAEPGIW